MSHIERTMIEKMQMERNESRRLAEKKAFEEKCNEEYNARLCDVYLCNGIRTSERWCAKHTILYSESKNNWYSWMWFTAPDCRPGCVITIVDSARTMCLSCSINKKIKALFMENTNFPEVIIGIMLSYYSK